MGLSHPVCLGSFSFTMHKLTYTSQVHAAENWHAYEHSRTPSQPDKARSFVHHVCLSSHKLASLQPFSLSPSARGLTPCLSLAKSPKQLKFARHQQSEAMQQLPNTRIQSHTDHTRVDRPVISILNEEQSGTSSPYTAQTCPAFKKANTKRQTLLSKTWTIATCWSRWTAYYRE